MAITLGTLGTMFLSGILSGVVGHYGKKFGTNMI